MKDKKNIVIIVLSVAFIISLASNLLPKYQQSQQAKRLSPLAQAYVQAKSDQEKKDIVASVREVNQPSLALSSKAFTNDPHNGIWVCWEWASFVSEQMAAFSDDDNFGSAFDRCMAGW
jgi:hypothetical protein